MQRREWLKLKRLKDEDDFKSKLELGERFLYGHKVTEQIANPGDNIWYYQVIKIDETVEYMPIFDILEKDREVQEFNLEEEK